MVSKIRKIVLEGDIGGEITTSGVRTALNYALYDEEVEKVQAFVSSPGGCVQEMVGIVNVIRNFATEKEFEFVIESQASSAASYILTASGCRVLGQRDTGMFLHRAQTITIGDDLEHENKDKQLKHWNSVMAKAIAERSGRSEEGAMELLSENRWFPVEELISLGLVDGYYTPDVEDNRRFLAYADQALVEDSLISANVPKEAQELITAKIKERAENIRQDMLTDRIHGLVKNIKKQWEEE